MDVKLLPTINSQLLELDRINGSDALATDVVTALANTVDGFDGERTLKNFQVELYNLYSLLLGCRPRMANLIAVLQKTLLFLEKDSKISPEQLSEFLRERLITKEERRASLRKQSLSLFSKEQTLLIHSYSKTLTSVLKYIKENATAPKILVAEQEKAKTSRLIKFLKKESFSFNVISEYSISQVLGEIDLALFGALTLNTRDEVVMGPGSAGLVSSFHTAHIPTYLLLTTNKFSFWEEETPTAFTENRDKEIEGLQYEKRVFSHDIIPVSFFTGIVTEEAILTPEELKQKFQSMQEAFFENEQRIQPHS